MKETRILMGMPVTLEVTDPWVQQIDLNRIFDYFDSIDRRFSTYKEDSEISRINKHLLELSHASKDMQAVFKMAEETFVETNGHFNILYNGHYDPSGIVKGWAIQNAADDLKRQGFQNYYVDAGGDIQAVGHNDKSENWRVGIRHPRNMNEIVKVLSVSNCAVATSGTYIRGQHIYDPKNNDQLATDILSLTVVGPNIYDADRYATAAFAMGLEGINFIEGLADYEGYMIDCEMLATFTSGFKRYVDNA